jgi:O-antigen/teichoic acid export membrane protein
MSALKLLLIGLGSRVTVIALAIGNTILLARWLGPAGIGEYFLLLRLVAVLTVLAGFGLNQSANVFSAHHEEWVGRIHRILVRFTLLAWLGIAIVGSGVIWSARKFLFVDFSHRWVWLSFVVLPLSLYAYAWNGMMIGRGRVWQVNWVQFVVSGASLVLTCVFIIGVGGGPLTAMLIYLAVTLIEVLIMLTIVVRTRESHDPSDCPADLNRQILTFGLRGYPGSVADLAWVHTPAFLLNAFHGPAAVGIFSIAQQMVEKLLLPVQAMQDAIFKKVSVLPRHEAIVALNRYIRLTLWTMTILILMGMISVPWILRLFLGNAYVRTGEVCRLLLPGSVVISVCFLLAVYFLGQLRRPGLLSIFGWLHALINLALSLIFIPKLAETGAALAVATAQIISGTCVIILYLRSAQTGIGQLLGINREDISMVRQQVGAMLRMERGAG